MTDSRLFAVHEDTGKTHTFIMLVFPSCQRQGEDLHHRVSVVIVTITATTLEPVLLYR